MRIHKGGFTLLELLIAAAIVSALAVLATRSYMNTMAEAHIQDGKTRARAVAAAMERFKIDYPTATWSNATLSHLNSLGECSVNRAGTNSPATLINCGYLDNRVWSDTYVKIEVCRTDGTPASGSICKNGAVTSPTTYPFVCMTGNADNAKVPAKFKYTSAQKAYLFCVTARGEVEKTI